MNRLLNTTAQNGVYYVTERQDQFSSVYLDVRARENRIYDDKVVSELPEVSKDHPYFNEWQLRQKSTKRIVNYLESKNTPLEILDIGCGNGWFSHCLASIRDTEVYGLDVNEIELEQAARVFNQPNLKFVYADLQATNAESLTNFDLVTVNSCIQYFSDFKEIFDLLTLRLKPNGELHILDSPFYDKSELADARSRTKAYYDQLGVPEMANHYFHHQTDQIHDFEMMYQPKKSRISRIFRKDSPFPWIKWINKK